MLSGPQSYMESNSASNWYSFQCNLLCRIQTGVEFCWVTQHIQNQICSTLLCTIYCLNLFAKMLSGPQSYMESNSKLTGMIYRYFYKHSSPQILLKLYNALILPHFNYCSSVWSPPDSSVNSSLFDSSNYFSLKVCSKIWSLNYHSLISHINIPSLVSRRNFSKLILLYKINNGLLYFPPNVLIPVPAPLHYSRHYNKLNFKPPFCSTQAYSSSFFPSVISLWNSLPDEAKTSSSLSSFRQIISLLSSQN